VQFFAAKAPSSTGCPGIPSGGADQLLLEGLAALLESPDARIAAIAREAADLP
jgi:hypothetical protein